MTEALLKEIFLNNLVAVKAVGRIDFFMLEGKQYVGKYDCDTLQHIYDELLLHEEEAKKKTQGLLASFVAFVKSSMGESKE